MFSSEHEPLALLVEVTPKLAKKRFRDEIYKAWNYCCGYCEAKATSLDHIVPRFKSGSTTRRNLLPACRRCNTAKGSEEMKIWFAKQHFFTEEKLHIIKQWMTGELIDIVSYQVEFLNSQNAY
jgi:5-methylcytosine-specific restriction endonuclease McrA